MADVKKKKSEIVPKLAWAKKCQSYIVKNILHTHTKKKPQSYKKVDMEPKRPQSEGNGLSQRKAGALMPCCISNGSTGRVA